MQFPMGLYSWKNQWVPTPSSHHWIDAAFERLPEGAVDALLIPENSDWLTEIILYHIVPGSWKLCLLGPSGWIHITDDSQ
jgi:hypothetical protein